VLKGLQAKLPTFETESLIPNALHALKQKLDETTAPAHQRWLDIKARRHDQFAALMIDLEGTLDALNARELLARLTHAAQRAKLDIVVNFEHLRHATPEALRALLDSEALRAITPYATVRYRKLKSAFREALESATPAVDHLLPTGLVLIEED
jgi:predicted aminopeptidase